MPRPRVVKVKEVKEEDVPLIVIYRMMKQKQQDDYFRMMELIRQPPNHRDQPPNA